MTFHRLRILLICGSLFAAFCTAQQKQPAQNPDQPRLDTGLEPPPEQVVKQQKPPAEPDILEDGGFSIEPIYWLNRAQPDVRGGATALEFGSIGFPGHANPSIGGDISIPAGHSNTLRLSYFRVQGHSNTTVAETADIFSEGYNSGDYIVESYKIQSFKVSWDYLSYTWFKPAGNIHLKTLYEVQYTSVGSSYIAPLKPITTDSSGNTDTNTTTGSKRIIYPTLGVEFEQALGHRFRWEAKATGFGIPHHGDIWDAQGDIAVRIGSFDLIAGDRAYHFKTSPSGDEYFTDTLSGAFVGLRYYLGARHW